MKVGIITIHNAINYGSALQAYALHKTIEDMRHNCYIINYLNGTIESLYRPKLNVKDIITGLLHLHLRSTIKEIIEGYYGNRYRILNIKFKLFWREYHKITKAIYDINSLADDEFDALICGSDQIWEPGITGGLDRNFFCDIKDKKIIKISYAASGGLPYKNQNDNYLFQKYIKNFDYISVRENEMAEYLEKINVKNVKVVADPTILLCREQWLKLIKKPKIENDYMFAYLMWEDNKILNTIAAIEKETGVKALIITRAKEYVIFNGKKIDTSNPYTFLGLIKEAKYVVSNSFHGTVLSIIFNKQFLSFNSGQRLQTLLGNLGLNQRLIEFDGSSHCKIDDVIDWENVGMRLQDLRNSSMDFLNKALKRDINEGI